MVDVWKTLKKSRARAMYKVLASGQPYEKGNLKIDFDGNTFTFYFRSDRPFLIYDMQMRRWEKVDCGEFENTASLHQQRKAMYEAIEEFNEKVLGKTLHNSID